MRPISPKKLQHEMLQVFSSKKQQGLFFFVVVSFNFKGLFYSANC